MQTEARLHQEPCQTLYNSVNKPSLVWDVASLLFHLPAHAWNHQRNEFQAALGDALLIPAWPCPFETPGSQAGSEHGLGEETPIWVRCNPN